jgi:hypothetical protein
MKKKKKKKKKKRIAGKIMKQQSTVWTEVKPFVSEQHLQEPAC